MFCWLYLSHTGWLTILTNSPDFSRRLSALNPLLPVSSGVISLPYCSQLFAHFHLCSKTEKWRRGRKRLNIKRPGEKKKKLHWHGKLFSVTVWEFKVKVPLLDIKTWRFHLTFSWERTTESCFGFEMRCQVWANWLLRPWGGIWGFPVHFNAESCFVAAASGGRQRNCSWTTCRFNSSTLQPEVNKHDWIFLSCNWHSFSPSILIR